jgi:hypothetical protein
MSIYKLLVVFVLISVFQKQSLACDVCGANGSMLGNGPMALLQNRAISWSTGVLKMQSTERALNEYSDIFIGSELGFRYSLGKNQRMVLLGNVGYGWNLRSNDSLAYNHGLSDPRLGAAYTLIDRSSDSLGKLRVQISTISTLPLGDYDPLLHDKNLPEYFNPGRGAWGLGYGLAVLKIHKRFFLSSNTLFQHFGASKNGGFRFGSVFNTQVMAGRTFGENFKWSPFVGARFEHIAQSRFANLNPVPSTEGSGLFSQIGVLINKESFFVNFNGGLPVVAHYAEQTVRPSFQFQIELNYRF